MVLRLADVDDVPTLDPAAGYDTASWTFEQAIFDTLVRYGDGNIELEPDIATSWESSPDATTFTFHMRGDARFSDGRAVTSEDFRYGVERVLNPATRSRGMEYYRGIVGADDFVAHRSAHLERHRNARSHDDHFPFERARPDLRAQARDAVCVGYPARRRGEMGRRLFAPRRRQRRVHAARMGQRAAPRAGKEPLLLQ